METNKSIFLEKFDYYEFQYLVTSKGIRAIKAHVMPFDEHFGYFYSLYNTEEKCTDILKIIKSIEPDQKVTLSGCNENFIEISSLRTSFFVTLPGFFPVDLPTHYFCKFIMELRDWISNLSNNQIPGVIPSSKLDTWTCVPKEY